MIRAVYDGYAILLVQQRTKNDIGAVAHSTMFASGIDTGRPCSVILWAFRYGPGIPARQADGLFDEYELYHRGEAARITTTVYDITGSEARTFSRFAHDYPRIFRERRFPPVA